MAGPRWEFTEATNFSQDRVLLILLDLSSSMEGNDITPTRLIRAKHEIEDIIDLDPTLKIGLMGFAADAHIISPITSNTDNIKHFLAPLGTDLIYVQGTRLVPALKTAQQMLSFEPGDNKSILIISDGGFADDETYAIIEDLAKAGIVVNTLGVGTEVGVNMIDEKGQFIVRNGKRLASVLEKDKLLEIARIGQGKYFDTDYSDINTKSILEQINLRSKFEEDENHQGSRNWRERFYILLYPVMLITLLWFRRGFYFPVILIALLASAEYAGAAKNNEAESEKVFDQLFLNKDQQAEKALNQNKDFDTAIKLFDDPYKKGVAYYKAGQYSEAEKYFCQNNRPEVQVQSLYNLANTLAKQEKLQEAMTYYQKALELDPNHEKSLRNIKIVKHLIFAPGDKKKDDEKNKKPNQPPPPGKDSFGGGGGGDGDGDDEEDEENQEDEENDGKDKGDPCDKDKDKADKADQDSDKSKNDSKSNPDKSQTGGGKGQIDDEEWLNQVQNNTSKSFLKNQFYLDSQKQNNNKQNLDPW